MRACPLLRHTASPIWTCVPLGAGARVRLPESSSSGIAGAVGWRSCGTLRRQSGGRCVLRVLSVALCWSPLSCGLAFSSGLPSFPPTHHSSPGGGPQGRVTSSWPLPLSPTRLGAWSHLDQPGTPSPPPARLWSCRRSAGLSFASFSPFCAWIRTPHSRPPGPDPPADAMHGRGKLLSLQ